MSKKLTPFEEVLREQMADYQTPYDIKSWYGIEKKMNLRVSNRAPWIVALVASFLVSGAIGYGVYDYRYSASEAMVLNNESKRFEKVSSENIKGGSIAFVAAQEEMPEEIGSLFSRGKQSSNNAISENNIGMVADTRTAVGSSGIVEIPVEKALNPTPAKKELAFASNVRQGCAGEEIEFKVTEGPTSGSYLWNFGDGRFSSDANPKHKFSKAGKYDVSLSITSGDGQIRTTVSNDMITIHPKPDADFQWSFVNDTPDRVEAQIVNTTNNANQYEWKFADGSGSAQASPVKSLDVNGMHKVTLHVSNDFGCTDDIAKQISVNPNFNIGAATVFHPGSELYMLSGLKNKDMKFELAIYNDNNEKVYETKSYLKGWNGKLADGSLAHSGKYKWRVLLTNAKSEQTYFNGEFTIFP